VKRVAVFPGLLVAYLVMYGAISAAFTAASADGGLLTPESAPDPVVVLLGLTTLVLRLGLLFGAVPLAVGWVARWAMRRGAA
jgi:hypothetical protein